MSLLLKDLTVTIIKIFLSINNMTNSIIALGSTDAELSQKVSQRKLDLYNQKITSEEQQRYIKLLDLKITNGELDLSDKALEKLRLMCQLWDVDIRNREISSHRKFIGPIIVGIKKAIFPIIRVFLKDFVRQQKDFNAATISLMGEILRKNENS